MKLMMNGVACFANECTAKQNVEGCVAENVKNACFDWLGISRYPKGTFFQ